MLKKMLYASAAILMLALAYHLGSTSAGAQVGEQLVDIAWRHLDGYAYGVTLSGAIYATPGFCQTWQPVGHMPAGHTAVCFVDGDVGGSLDIACSDGSAWTVQGSVPSITLTHCSEVFGGPTPARPATWGSMKARYR